LIGFLELARQKESNMILAKNRFILIRDEQQETQVRWPISQGILVWNPTRPRFGIVEEGRTKSRSPQSSGPNQMNSHHGVTSH
jgi:hypothetical protein